MVALGMRAGCTAAFLRNERRILSFTVGFYPMGHGELVSYRQTISKLPKHICGRGDDE